MVTTMMSPRDDQPARVVDLAAAADERAAVDPHHHRSRRSPVDRRRPDVQAQAVLVGLPAEFRVGTGILDASRPRLGGVAHPVPCRRRRRRPPAQRADRRCGVRDSGEQPVVPLDLPRTVPVAVCTSEVSDCGAGVGTTGDGASRSGMADLGDAPTSRPSATTSTVAITTIRTTRRLRAVPGCTKSEPTQAFAQTPGSRMRRSPRLRT